MSQKTIYTWRGTNNEGKLAHGEIAMENPALVKAYLMQQGIIPTKISKKRSDFFTLKRKPKVKYTDVISFTKNVGTMLKSGLSLMQGLSILKQSEENETMKEVINSISESIKHGQTLADSLRLHPKLFSDMYCNLIQIAENSGTLDIIFDQLIVSMNKSLRLKRKVKKALTYPLVTLAVALSLAVMMLVWVVPSFQKNFASLGGELPAFTVAVINVSDFLQNYYHYLIPGIIASVMLFLYLKRNNNTFAYGVDALMLKIPNLGNIIQKVIIARFTQTLGTTLSAGVPLLDSLDLVAETAGNQVYIKGMKQITKSVSEGESLHKSMNDTGLFPLFTIQMISVGEQTGKLDQMMVNTALVYEEETDVIFDNISILIEPVVIVLIGGIVGSILIAMYLPIFMMGDLMSG